MPNIKQSEKQYEKLRDELQDIIAENRAKLEAVARETAVRTHWEIGRCLYSSLGDDETGPYSKIIERLALDLNLHHSVLYRSSKFYRTYPDALPSGGDFAALSWSSHVLLLPITTEEERLFYINRAAGEKWSVKQLRHAIKADEYAGGGRKNKKAKALKALKRPSPGLYTYEAFVERVVDGDTIIVRMDLGFDVLKRERIRLRGIDAAEMGTDEGEKSRRFLEKKLRKIEKVILRTHWHDMYGRYVADVMYDSGNLSKDEVLKKGRFLNQELLDSGMALYAGP